MPFSEIPITDEILKFSGFVERDSGSFAQTIYIISIPHEIQTVEDALTFAASDANKIYRGRRAKTGSSHDPIVVRLAPEFLYRKSESKITKFINNASWVFARNASSPTYVQYVKSGIVNTTENLNQKVDCFFSKYDLVDKTESLRQLELAHMFVCSGVLYRPPKDYIFQLPSSELSEVFFRVGNLQHQPTSLSSLQYWLYPHVYGRKMIVADTWSISTTLLSLARRLSASNPQARPIQVEFLSRYYNRDHGSQSDLERIFGHIEGHKSKPLFVLSGTATGRSLERLLDDSTNIYKVNRKNLDAVVVAKFGKAGDLPALADFSTYCSDIYPKKFSGPAIPVDPATYFPSFQQPAVKPLLRRHIEASREFFHRYAGHNLFQVHKMLRPDAYLIHPHQAFFVDFQKMVRTDAFKKRLKEKWFNAQKVCDISAIIATDTEQNREFIRTLNKLGLKKRAFFISRRDDVVWGKIARAVKRSRKTDRIVVVESVSVTANTIGMIQGKIRRDSLGENVEYLIGLARPENSEKWSSQIRRLGIVGSDLSCIEELVLPNWGKRRCPWCRELEIWQSADAYGADVEARAHVRRRMQGLIQNPNDGMEDRIFLHQNPDSYAEEFYIGPKSFFIDSDEVSGAPDDLVRLTDAEVACASASAMQRWRTENKSGYSGGLQLDPRQNIEGSVSKLSPDSLTEAIGYRDPKLRAAIWRSALDDEIFPLPPLAANEVEAFLEILLGRERTGAPQQALRSEAILRFPKSVDALGNLAGLTAFEDTLLEFAVQSLDRV